MFVLGVDPGLSRCGFAVIRPDRRGRGVAESIGVITTPPGDAVADRLAEVQRELRDVLRRYHPAVVAVERIFFQNNVRTAVSVAQVSGLVLAEAVAAGADVVEYSPNQVKSAVAGDGRADKQQVQEMVRVLLGLGAVPRPADAADAAAVALCHLANDPSGFVGARRATAAR